MSRRSSHTTIDSKSIGKYVVEVHVDEDGDISNPRDWSSLGTLISWSTDCAHSDKDQACPDPSSEFTPDDFIEWCAETGTIYLEVRCLRGNAREFVYATKEKIAEEYFTGGKKIRRQDRWAIPPIDDELKAKVCEVMRCEIETYRQWCDGEVYGYVVRDNETEEVVDSCWGYVGGATIDGKELDGVEYCMREGVGVAEGIIEREKQEEEAAKRYMAL